MKGNYYNYYVYLLSSKKNGTLYIGVTNDLERRMFEHKNKLVSGFTAKYNVNKLMYFEDFQYVNDALKREKQLKNWNRQWKIDLIEKENKEWKDLSIDWKY
ncbi:excinuclease ABC, C subunit-like [Mesoflavibacter sp. HG96]|uniref:GIY-YIG nuclease family protein n=1 Tax=Mesoflavibacter TaxID=444051 RepID=UPI000D114C23|nr:MULTISPECIES: GIY-YIG nuclease family protein [Mesoflavibacter]QIJ90154.1 excinuclease ABC, C subunit-like [Mesoflavibacter sp. HG96]QIJ92882.1 excinuclease ABC, C subunit-like [Mesoflavibacter sp. HG37]